MISSIWFVNFMLLYMLNPKLGAMMPSYWAPTPSNIASAIIANSYGQVPYSQYSAYLPSYQSLLGIYVGNGMPGPELKGAPATGPAKQAALAAPAGIAVDPSGNTYIADTNNYVQRHRETDLPPARWKMTDEAFNGSSDLRGLESLAGRADVASGDGASVE